MKYILAFLCFAANIAFASEKANQQIEISEKCYQDCQNIKKDAVLLKYYFKDVWKRITHENDPRYISKRSLSDIMKWYRDGKVQLFNETVKCTYQPALWYMNKLITNQSCQGLDDVFFRKFNETRDISAAIKAGGKHVSKNILIKLLDDFCKEMIEQDVARIRLARNERFFIEPTIIMTAYDISIDAETMRQIKENCNTLYKK